MIKPGQDADFLVTEAENIETCLLQELQSYYNNVNFLD